MQTVRFASQITHSNLEGINGALFQTFAVKIALDSDESSTNWIQFLEEMKVKMADTESTLKEK